MNPETKTYTREREANTIPFVETLQDGDNARNRDGIGQNDTNRGLVQGQYQQDGIRTNDNQDGSKEQRKDEGNKGTIGTNR